MKNYQYWARRNAFVSYCIDGFENASASLPIWLLFFTRQLHLSVTAAIVLFTARWAVMALCNVPTGAWADRFGRVKLYRIGQLCYALTYVPFLLTANFTMLLIVQIIGGFFGSMSIGTIQPLIQDTYVLAKFSNHRYTKYLSTDTVVLYMARLVAGIFGAWLYVRHPYEPYVSEIVVLLAAFAASFFLKEFRLESTGKTTNREHIREALHYVWQHRYLRNFFFAMVLEMIAAESVWTGLQPIFVYKNISLELFGWLFAVVALLSAIGAYTSRAVLSRVGGISVQLYMATGALLGIVLLLVHGAWLVVPALILLGLSFGFSAPVGSFVIQKYTSDKHQSTVLSLKSLLYTGFYAGASVLVGRYVDLFGTRTMLIILFIQAIICVSIISLIWLATRNVYKPKSQNPQA